MRVNSASLSSHLAQGVQPLYLLFGAETLLVEETLDQIRKTAIQQGFNERLRFTVEAGFDWNQLVQQSQSMSLFAEKRLIELRMPTGKPGDAGAKALIDYTERGISDETILVIVCGAIEKRAQNTKWFKTVEAAATVSECPSIAAGKLPDWIGQRMMKKGLQFEPQALEMLAHYVEGNLLAASQEINLLALLYPETTITTDIIDQVIADHARFNAFSLSDACLAGSVQRVTRILSSLKREQVEPLSILWALARDTRILCQLSNAVEKGTNPQSLFQKFGIWSSRSTIVSSALKRQGRIQWENILRRIGQADLMAKGSAPLKRRDIWEEIESIALGMCSKRSA